MTPRGRHPQKPKMRLSQKERDIADVATFQLWSSSDDYNRYIEVKHALMAQGMERSEAEGEAVVRVVKEREKP